ncbi:Hypothetical predicted protein [Mytilus galloprovincialis]|uniref:Uncharacterized protein n=1 Tax=Mytilus galloprovincialis TaxID=29158 RepID=A0A8B6EZX9_MYTGA|nr:Hypothetical predicted protein [Mytilus galloprovincialis]
MDNDSPEIKSLKSVTQNIGDEVRANKAQVATGQVLLPVANYARLIFAVKHTTQNMLKELLERYISPKTLYAQVKSKPNLRRRLNVRDWKAINSAENKGYIDFDVPLIYTIVRVLYPNTQPTRGWDHPADPQPHETLLGDDVEHYTQTECNYKLSRIQSLYA